MMSQAWIRVAVLSVFWMYELGEATSHVAYAYNWQTRPERLQDAFYFGTMKEMVTNAGHLILFLVLLNAGLGTVDIGLLALLTFMHFIFTINGLRKGRAVDALAHGYEHGLIPFKSPPLEGPYLEAFATKVLSHIDSGIHVYFAIKVAFMLPLAVVVPVLVLVAICWRRITIDGRLIDWKYNALVYGSHAIAFACCLTVR